MMIGKYLAAAAAAVVLLCQPEFAVAEDVAVKKNGTPLLQAPTSGATTAWKVNSGFPLSVVEERGGWMRVQSAALPKGTGDLWVRSSQVSAVGGASTAAATGDLEEPIGYRIELTGTANMKFKMECRIVRDGRVSFRPHFNRLPQTYEFSADPFVCYAWKKAHDGVLELALIEVYPSRERVIGRAALQGNIRDHRIEPSIVARTRGPDYPTDLFNRSETPWGPEVVKIAKKGSLYLPPSTPP